MSITFGSPDLMRLQALCAQYDRPVEHWDGEGPNGVMTPVFVPPLTPAEQAILDDLTVIASLALPLTLAEFQACKADVAGLVAYMGLPSPTAAQMQAAFKALVRVTGAMLRVQLGG